MSTAPSPAELLWRIRWLAGTAIAPPPEPRLSPAQVMDRLVPAALAEIAAVRPDGAAAAVDGMDWVQRDLTAVVRLHGRLTRYVAVPAPLRSGRLSPPDAYNDRIDALDLRVETDRAGRLWPDVVYVQGTPAACPAEPCLSVAAVRLGTIDVPAMGVPQPTVRSTLRRPVADRLGGDLRVTVHPPRPFRLADVLEDLERQRMVP